MWEDLPDLLLEEIFSMLSMREKYYCSMVCKNWYCAFFSPRLWRKLRVRELSFTCRRFHFYKGYQDEINHTRVQMYLAMVGRHLHTLIIDPISNFHNLYEFLEVVCAFLEFFREQYPLPHLHTFEFSFACEMRTLTGSIILGTGGKLLEELKRLFASLQNLHALKLNNLLLDNKETHGLLDNVVENCRDTLTDLEILNTTKIRHPLFHVGMFTRLERLTISPLQLTDDVLMMLAKNTNLQQLIIVQDKYTNEAEAVNPHVWWLVRQEAPRLKVKLEVRGQTDMDVLIQEHAPVRCIIFNTPYATITPANILQVADIYQASLQTYGHLGLPRRHGSRSFHDRGDSCLLLLVRECRRLQTLVIRERVSTATLLLLAHEGKQLKQLHVRRNAVLLRCDWPRSPEWSDDHYSWLKSAARSFTVTDDEISKLLKRPWHMLSDAEFKKLKY